LERLSVKDVGKFDGHLVYFTAISYILLPLGYILWPFWYIFPVLVCCANKIWQPLGVGTISLIFIGQS
jgi:hypothetical protein